MSSPESVKKAFYAVRRLIFEDFDAAFHLRTGNRTLVSERAVKRGGGAERASTHIDFGRLGESSHRVDVVVQDDDSDHDPQTERHRLLACESATVLPGGTRARDYTHEGSGVRSQTATAAQRVTHGVSNMTLHTVAIVLRQSVVFSMGRFLFWTKTAE